MMYLFIVCMSIIVHLGAMEEDVDLLDASELSSSASSWQSDVCAGSGYDTRDIAVAIPERTVPALTSVPSSYGPRSFLPTYQLSEHGSEQYLPRGQEIEPQSPRTIENGEEFERTLARTEDQRAQLIKQHEDIRLKKVQRLHNEARERLDKELKKTPRSRCLCYIGAGIAGACGVTIPFVITQLLNHELIYHAICGNDPQG